jgi:CRISPR/Cas system-associated exonuclease Cas4 (RecB family)
MLELNLSPTSINEYRQSQLQFYYDYIAKAKKDTETPECYGLAGSLVHSLLETYKGQELDLISTEFNMLWTENNLENLKDIKGKNLDKGVYWKCILTGLDKVKFLDVQSKEETITYPLLVTETHKITAKGIIDLVIKENNNVILLDWKTSNSLDLKGNFELQAKMYCYLYYLKWDVIPSKFRFEYLKKNEVKEYTFSKKDLEEFGVYLNNLAKEVINKGTNILNYELGNFENIFNSHLEKCSKEFLRRRHLD